MHLGNDMRQNIQIELDFSSAPPGETRGQAGREETESLPAVHGPESPASMNRLMEEVCERENLKESLRQVKANKGSAGVDGMAVAGVDDYLKQHWPAAVARAQQYIAEGHSWCIDLDLEKFLDTASYCPRVHECCLNSAGCARLTKRPALRGFWRNPGASYSKAIQNWYRSASWICRASVALVTRPKAVELKLVFGSPILTVFVRLKNSPRSSIEWRSRG